MSGCEWERDIDLDIQMIKQWGASLVLGFPEDHEFKLLQVENIHNKFIEYEIPFIHIPFIDDTTPDDKSAKRIKSYFPIIDALLKDHKNVLFFCKGGSGKIRNSFC